jgi:hypothetical protein
MDKPLVTTLTDLRMHVIDTLTHINDVLATLESNGTLTRTDVTKIHHPGGASPSFRAGSPTERADVDRAVITACTPTNVARNDGDAGEDS